jgi:segregation and condensation protein A
MECEMAYKVKLDVFEGPFDLLVYLIENAEMSIYDIQVFEITKQYMEYIEHMQKTDVVLAGEFMVLAASLIEIKSKMLLPRMKHDEGAECLEDPRNELVQKLLEYKRYKAAATLLEGQEERNLQIYCKPQEDLTIFTNSPEIYLDLDLSQFVKAFNLFLQKKMRLEEVKKVYSKVERQRMSMETRIEQMKVLFLAKKKLRFQELLNGENSRYNIILTFVSMLELVRQKNVKVRQTVNFGEIILTACETETLEEMGA